MKISKVLHKAADKHLAHDYASFAHPSLDKERFSCTAICLAVNNDYELEDRVRVGLQNMGCPTNSTHAFRDMGYDDDFDIETQGARYMWLKFAALMAEEQGV